MDASRPLDPSQLAVASEIGRAETLPGGFYGDESLHALARERVFAASWQLVADAERVKVPGQVHPVILLEGCLDEPLLLTRDADDRIHCVANVCTHRGNLLCEGDGVEQVLRCRYHGRRFGLDGRFLSMPEFDGVEGFPSAADDLPPVPFARWRRFLFASLAPPFPFEELVSPMEERVGFLPIEHAAFDPASSRDYLVKASWALYCDNYLEGFHIPYVHSALAGAVDYDLYRVELFAWSSLQVGVAGGAEDVFELPASHPDAGQRILAYYFWLFPNLMFNVYPWGMSINVVQPLAPDRARVRFLDYVWDREALARAAYSIDRVEREDEAIVEAVQRGVRSRFYHRGRYSVAREGGVHHFHRLLADRLAAGGECG